MNYQKIDKPTTSGKYMWRSCPNKEWHLALVRYLPEYGLFATFPDLECKHYISHTYGEWRIILDPTE